MIMSMSDDLATRAAALLFACVALAASSIDARAQAAGATPAIARTVNRAHTIVQQNGRPVVRVDARAGEGMAIIAGAPFLEGTIELDVRGEDVQQQSFVGVAFGVQDDSTYEAVYLRPFNFRTPDTARAKRALQYVSQPAYPWPKLRQESPGKYEQPVRPAPDPVSWVRMRLVVTRTLVSVYANGGDEPDLVVTRLGDVKPGPVALWVGNNSRGDFANLTVIAAPPTTR
jgi:hypothetical protein